MKLRSWILLLFFCIAVLEMVIFAGVLTSALHTQQVDTIPKDTLNQKINESTQYTLLIVLLAQIILVVITIIALNRAIIRPLELLTELSRKIATTGNFDQTIDTKGAGEIGILARSFKTMVETIRAKEQELQESNSELHSIIQGSPIPQFVIDRDHRILHWNTALEKCSGIRAEEVIGTNQQWKAFYKTERPVMADLLIDGLNEKNIQFFAGKCSKSKLLEGAYEAIDFFPNMGPSGKWLYFTAVPIRNLQGTIIGAVETLEDISEHKRDEEMLIRYDSRIRQLYESMMDAFCRVNMDGQILEYNPSFKEILGYSGEELVKLTYQELTPEKWHAIEKKIITTQVLPRGYSDVYEKEYRKKDGTVFPIEIRTTLIQDDTGQPAGMWGIIRDITERKRAEEKIILANRKLALMSEVAYQDIQNKVTGLRGYVVLSKELKSEQDRISFIDKELEILESIHALIKKTKEYQQMGVDKSRWIQLEPTIRTEFSLLSIKHTVTLDCDLPGLEIYADPLINRIFYNLMQNAIQHGKTLTRITFGCHEIPEGLVLTCQDNGIGIPVEQKPHIFDRVVGGEGKFGLFFVREFLLISGMTIDETGIPGKGALFEITIPKGLYRFTGEKKS
ncbi:MAG TPA: PAS domain S-box protein [Methanoregula sp.]|nr:PAS domain S-box protein [Methanoregula sp.]